MSRLTSPRVSSGLALLFAVSCARSELYLSAWTEGEIGGTGGSGGSGQGGAGVPVGGSGGTAAQGGGVPNRGGTGGILGGGPGVGGRGGSGGTALPRGGSAGKTGGQGGTSGVGGSAGRPPVERCRDGVVDPGEECDAGEGPYAHPAIELRTNGIVIELAPVIGSGDVYEAYGYSNHSSHTGNENVSGSKLYFYRPDDESGVYLFIHHGIDFLTTGFVQPAGQVHFEITGLPTSSYLAVSDDPGEVVQDSPSSVLADWTFELNTAGLALGGIAFPGSWHIVVMPTFLEGIDTFTALSGDGYRTGLSLVRDVELVASREPGGCRRDCTLPRCGDGRLDAGETCDDGNDEDRDGCTECEADVPIPPG